jgi:Domain of unknown function (DUF4272)
MKAADLRSITLRRFEEWRLHANESLPLVESESDIQPKSSERVAARIVAASYVAACCFGAPTAGAREDLERFALWGHLTDEEQRLFLPDRLTPGVQAYNSWLVESIHFMAWALGLTRLDHFSPCDERLAQLLPGTRDPREFICSAQLRSLDEMRQESDTLYMLHWCAVEAQVTGNCDDRVVLPRVSFRRHAADWVVGTADRWGDVALDT